VLAEYHTGQLTGDITELEQVSTTCPEYHIGVKNHRDKCQLNITRTSETTEHRWNCKGEIYSNKKLIK
jgi:hypothetical protein